MPGDDRPGMVRRAVSVVLEPYYYVGPGLILIALVMLVPLIVGIGYSFQNVQILNPFKTGWVGLQHYRALLHDPVFGHALLNTLWWTFASLALQFALGLGLALLLERALPRPQAGAGAGVPALGGAELHLRPRLGLAVQPDHRPAAALAVRARACWPRPTTSWPIPRSPCGGRSPPMSGGACRSSRSRCWRRSRRSRARCTRRRRSTAPAPWQRFRHVTLPFLAPTIAITVLLRTIWISNFADLIVVMTGGGPANTTQILPSYIFTTAYKKLDFGYAATLSMALLLLLFLYSAVADPAAPQPEEHDVSRARRALAGRRRALCRDPGLRAVRAVPAVLAGQDLVHARSRCSTARASGCGRRRRRSTTTASSCSSRTSRTSLRTRCWSPSRRPLAVTVLAGGAGYALSRFTFRAKSAIAFLLLLTQMFPLVMLIPPIYRLMTPLGLTNSLFGLIVVYTAFNVPFATFLMQSFFDGIPVQLEEAAMIDGCTRLGRLAPGDRAADPARAWPRPWASCSPPPGRSCCSR